MNGGPGASAGCVLDAVTPPGESGLFAYQQAFDSAGLESVGVVSTRFGANLFLAPATTPVMTLIQTVGEIGGTLREPVANGDIYFVWDQFGSVTLVRDETSITYQELPEAVTDAWIRCDVQGTDVAVADRRHSGRVTRSAGIRLGEWSYHPDTRGVGPVRQGIQTSDFGHRWNIGHEWPVWCRLRIPRHLGIRSDGKLGGGPRDFSLKGVLL